MGLLLGPEGGIIDIECDGPEGEDSLAKLMGGEIILTLGWSSARGPHHVFRYDARLARYGKSIIKLPELPGLEIRIGGNGKQLQSNCPPTIGTDGKPREWNGNDIVADLPEAVFSFLDAALTKPKSKPGIVAPAPMTMTATSARDAYATKALDDECQAVALAPDGEQNETLNTAAFNLGQLVGAGVLDRSEVERCLLDAAAGYVQKDGEAQARKTIQSGLNAGQNQPRDLSHLEANRNGRHESGKSGVPTGPPPWPPLRFSEPPRALPFPVDVFPMALQDYCRELAEATLAPLDFVGLSMLVTAGAAIGQSLNIRVKREWNESPLLFGIIVAQPGKTKSPVVRAVVKPLTEIDRRLREETRSAREQWGEAKKAHDKKPDSNPPPGPEPPQLRAIVKDITRESLVIILADNPRGVLCDPDEASGWVASFNEYKGKGGSDRQFWLSVWGSAPVSVDRKGGRESTYVPFPFVSVLGGLPPDMLTSLRDERGRNDGFLDRIIFSYPDSFPPQRWTERELSLEAESDWSEAIGRLFTRWPCGRKPIGRPAPPSGDIHARGKSQSGSTGSTTTPPRWKTPSSLAAMPVYGPSCVRTPRGSPSSCLVSVWLVTPARRRSGRPASSPATRLYQPSPRERRRCPGSNQAGGLLQVSPDPDRSSDDSRDRERGCQGAGGLDQTASTDHVSGGGSPGASSTLSRRASGPGRRRRCPESPRSDPTEARAPRARQDRTQAQPGL